MMREDLPVTIHQHFHTMKNEGHVLSPPGQKFLDTALGLSTRGFLKEVDDEVVKGWEIETIVFFSPLGGRRQIEDKL